MIFAVTEFYATALLLSVFGVLMAVSVLFGRTFERLGVPVVLFFLLLGMVAGSEGLGRVAFNNYQFAFRVGTAALILILFDGGFHTPIAALRESYRPAGVLATVGVIITAGMVALIGRVLGLSWGEAMLLGAVVSSTDAAAVFAVLRGGQLRLIRRIGTTIELESGINDPMAVILTLAVTRYLSGEHVSTARMVIDVPLQLAIGVIVGLGFGFAVRAILNRVRLSTGGFYPVLTLAVAFLAFGVATLAGGSGFLAVYVVAVLLGNTPIPYRNGLSRIHDALAWLSQISMFLMLGLLVFPSNLLPVAAVGLGVALFLALVGRPIAVALCLLPFRFPLREVAYVGWVGLRGAVPIILATYPVLVGVDGADKIFNIVFFIVVVGAIIPGAGIRFMTRRLRLEAPDAPIPSAALEIHSTRLLRGELLSFFITPNLAVCNARLSQVPFPQEVSVILVVRGEELIAPRGSTTLLAGDHVYVFCRPEDEPFIRLLFGRSTEGA